MVGNWAAAARRQGLRFGVTVHQARNWWWFQTSHGARQAGRWRASLTTANSPRAEGKDAVVAGDRSAATLRREAPFDALPDASYVKNFYDRTRDLIDQHDPDLLYFDNSLLPLGWGGMNIGAYFYNNNLKTRAARWKRS